MKTKPRAKAVSNSEILRALRDHDEWERSITAGMDPKMEPLSSTGEMVRRTIDGFEKRTQAVEGHIIVLNSEMGEVKGLLKGISASLDLLKDGVNARISLLQWIFGATALVIVVGVVMGLLRMFGVL